MIWRFCRSPRAQCRKSCARRPDGSSRNRTISINCPVSFVPYPHRCQNFCSGPGMRSVRMRDRSSCIRDKKIKAAPSECYGAASCGKPFCGFAGLWARLRGRSGGRCSGFALTGKSFGQVVDDHLGTWRIVLSGRFNRGIVGTRGRERFATRQQHAVVDLGC